MVSALRGDGSARRGGVALAAARRAKERRCPELVGRGWLCWLWKRRNDGRQKHRSFCPSCREPEPGQVLKVGSSVDERSWRGGFVGGVCWRAQ